MCARWEKNRHDAEESNPSSAGSDWFSTCPIPVLFTLPLKFMLDIGNEGQSEMIESKDTPSKVLANQAAMLFRFNERIFTFKPCL